ncbi:hypothetical protein NDU88_007419 [Pleurodeles waltl]|uniref:Uncharacterized protein n=1 Tax=Pleurodeles waltl TaxID=8319 RepID=A0AAV7U0B6_PLEWA|nr:hypothetical protein NDU88_007419 [Pleurodeles waltl]
MLAQAPGLTHATRPARAGKRLSTEGFSTAAAQGVVFGQGGGGHSMQPRCMLGIYWQIRITREGEADVTANNMKETRKSCPTRTVYLQSDYPEISDIESILLDLSWAGVPQKRQPVYAQLHWLQGPFPPVNHPWFVQTKSCRNPDYWVLQTVHMCFFLRFSH